MNTGAEAVETAIKVGPQVGLRGQGRAGRAGRDRRRGRQLPRPDDDDHQLLRPTRTRAADFGPYTPGFGIVPFGDIEALRGRDRRRPPSPCCSSRSRARPASSCRRPATCPTCGELPRETQRAARRRRDPVRAWAAPARPSPATHEGVVPDVYVLGKALGGGIVPVSAVVARRDVLGVLTPGQPRLDVRRQPARLRGRPGGGRAAARPASSRQRARRARRRCCTSGLRELVGRGVIGGARPRAVGRRRHRPALMTGRRAVRAAARARRPGQGHPRLDDPARPAARRGAR